MNRQKSLRTIKWMFLITFLMSSLAFLAFQPGKPDIDTETLFFRYQNETYNKTDVESNNNWALVEPEEECTHQVNDAACSFAIEVETPNRLLYLSGTHPSSRVIIEAMQSSLSSNYFTSNVKENISGSPVLPGTISNILP